MKKFFIENKTSLLIMYIFILNGCVSSVTSFDDENHKINKLEEKSLKKPEKNRLGYIKERQDVIDRKLKLAQSSLLNGDVETALINSQQVLILDAYNEKALNNISNINNIKSLEEKYILAEKLYEEQQFDSSLILLKEILKIQLNHPKALTLRNKVEQYKNTKYLNPNLLNKKLDSKVSIEFKNAPVFSVLDVLSQQSGLNFIVDKDANIDQNTTTIFAKNTTVREALETILYTSSLSYKILNSNTYLIYKKTEENQRKYDELITKSYYLGYADSQKAQDMIAKIYQPKAIFFDDRLRMLIIRDNKNVISSIDKLLQAYDVPSPEVLLDIEVLEVSRGNLLNLGIDFPNKIEGNLLNSVGGVGSYTINELKNVTKDSVSLIITDPKLALNFKQESNKANLLANPRIRIKTKEKAEFLIGDKVPVITTTTSELGGSVAEAVNYLDVGLKLEVTPDVKLNREVQIGIKLEVSNIVKEVKTSRGLTTYQIGTRNASTVLQLKDNETQMLAGLIKNDDKSSASHLPGIGKIPLLGRLFSNTQDSSNKSEIVLLITPKIIRPFQLPEPYIQEHISGTLSEVTDSPIRLTDESSYQVKPVIDGEHNFSTRIETASVDSNKLVIEQIIKPIALEVPRSIGGNHSFVVNALLNIPEAEKISFDLKYPGNIELNSVNFNIAVKKAETEKIEGGIRVILEGVSKLKNISLPIHFMVKKSILKPIELELSNYTVKDKFGNEKNEIIIDEKKVVLE